MQTIIITYSIFVLLYCITGWLAPWGRPLQKFFSKKKNALVCDMLWVLLTIFYIENNSATWICVVAYLVTVINLYEFFKNQTNDWKLY